MIHLSLLDIAVIFVLPAIASASAAAMSFRHSCTQWSKVPLDITLFYAHLVAMLISIGTWREWRMTGNAYEFAFVGVIFGLMIVAVVAITSSATYETTRKFLTLCCTPSSSATETTEIPAK